MSSALCHLLSKAHFKQLFAIEDKDEHGEGKGDASSARPDQATRSRRIIVALYRWLQSAGHVAAIAIPKIQPRETKTVTDRDTDRGTGGHAGFGHTEQQREQLIKRVLADHQWDIVNAAIERLDWFEPLQSRCRAISGWLRESGARREELASARLGAMQRHTVAVTVAVAAESTTATDRSKSSATVWLWRIRGKRNKVRYVVVTPSMLDSFEAYRLSQGIPFFDDDPFLVPRGAQSPDKYLFYAIHGKATEDDAARLTVHQQKRRSGARSVSATTIYNDVKTLAAAAAKLCSTDVDHIRVAALSPRWFRHRRALELTKWLTITQVAQYLGHASI